MRDQAKMQQAVSTESLGFDFLRGEVRLLFDMEKRKYYTTIFDHNSYYDDVIWPRGVRMIPDNLNSLALFRQTDKCAGKAVEHLENVQKVKHLRELDEQESRTVVSNKEGAFGHRLGCKCHIVFYFQVQLWPLLRILDQP